MAKRNRHVPYPPQFRRDARNDDRPIRPGQRTLFVPLGFGCLLAGVCVGPVEAQDALQSALSINSILQAQENRPGESPPGQPHLGPVQLSYGVYSGVQFNDNINLAQNNAQTDVILDDGLSFGAFWPATAQSQLNFNSGIGYNYYLRHPNDSYWNLAPGSTFNWSVLLEDWTLTIYDQFNYTHNVTQVASVSNVSGIPIFDNSAGLQGQWQPDHWLVVLGYSYDNYFSNEALYDYLNNFSDNFFARGAWRFANATQLGVEASSAITQFSKNIQPDSTSYSLGPYLQWQVTKAISNSLRGGWTYYSFASTPMQPSGNLSSYYFGLDLNHRLTQFVSQSLSAQRSTSLGINSGSDYSQQYTVNYGVHWFATQWLRVDLNLTYENGQQPVNGISTQNVENYQRYGVNPGLFYQITKRLSGTLGYSFWDKNSTIDGNSYKQNTVNFQLQYNF